jgi:hypothetical protein
MPVEKFALFVMAVMIVDLSPLSGIERFLIRERGLGEGRLANVRCKTCFD